MFADKIRVLRKEKKDVYKRQDTSSPATPVQQPDACRRGGTAGRHDRFSEYVRSYRLRKIQRNSYNLLPFVIIRHFPLPVKSKIVKKVLQFLVFPSISAPQHLVGSHTFARSALPPDTNFCDDILIFQLTPTASCV